MDSSLLTANSNGALHCTMKSFSNAGWRTSQGTLDQDPTVHSLLRKVCGGFCWFQYVKSRYASFKVARASFKPEAVTLSEESWLLAKGLDPWGAGGCVPWLGTPLATINRVQEGRGFHEFIYILSSLRDCFSLCLFWGVSLYRVSPLSKLRLHNKKRKKLLKGRGIGKKSLKGQSSE